MATVVISEQDVISADAYLGSYLKGKIPDADFSQGSVVRDFVVKAIAHIFAFFRAEIQKTRDQQSLLALQSQPPSAEVDEAVDAILSNLFIPRRSGAPARVVATLHFTQRVDVVVAATTRFVRDGQTFLLDSDVNLFIPALNLRAVLTASGAAEYVTTVTLVCTTTGLAGNVTPGRFSAADRFSAVFSYAENLDYGIGGLDVESTAQLLARAPTALAVRNLANVRSVQAVLLDAFPTLAGVFTAGFGDPEITRDRATEGVKLPTVALTETYVVGAAAQRADGVTNVLYDAAASFLTGTPVTVGDVLKVHSGIRGAPREFLIKDVTDKRLFVSERGAFSSAAVGVSYSVGAAGPFYTDKRGVVDTGETTNYVQEPNAVFLTGRPRGKIRKLEVETAPNTWLSLERVNVATLAAGQYCVTVVTPAKFQSPLCVEKISVPAGYDGKTLRMTFDTLAGFDVVSERVTNSFERNVCANNLVRGFIPVYLGVAAKYALAAGGVPVDDALLRKSLATFLYDWDTTKPLDVSAVTQFLRETFPAINRFYDPVTLFFTVYSPDGQLYEFQSTDVVEVFPDGVANVSLVGEGSRVLRDEAVLSGMRFPNNETVFAPSLLALQSIFEELGISRRNIRFLPDADAFSIAPYVD